MTQGLAASPVARAAYVTPSDQAPSGVVLSMARRLELLAWARDAHSWVIEDDYDSEFRYAGQPLAALQESIEASGLSISVRLARPSFLACASVTLWSRMNCSMRWSLPVILLIGMCRD